MGAERMIDPGHDGVRAVLRVVGPTAALVGLGLLAVGLISFFSSFGTFEPPRYFWCAFVGLPMLGIGLAITQFAYMGSIFRYILGETAPVGKDAFDYMARGTAPAAAEFVRQVSRGAAEGFQSAGGGTHAISCPQCGAEAQVGAHFCSGCGARMTAADEADAS